MIQITQFTGIIGLIFMSFLPASLRGETSHTADAKELFVRGSFNDWGTTHKLSFSRHLRH
jgi:hypothetical protein